MSKLLKDVPKDIIISKLKNSYFQHMYLDLSFQRISSWSVEKNQEYMKSLLEGKAKSPLTIADATACLNSLNNKEEQKYFIDILNMGKFYISVDGNNRKEAIEGYLNDEYSIRGIFSDEHGTIHKINDKKYSELDFETKNLIDNTEVRISSFVNASYDELRETFNAINDGLPLNPAEKRNAIGTRQASHVRELAMKYEDIIIEYFGEQVYKRRGGDNFIAFCLELEETVLKKGVTSTSVTKFYKNENILNSVFESNENNIKTLFRILDSTVRPKDFSVSWAISLYFYLHKLRKNNIIVNKNKVKEFGVIYWEQDMARRMHDKNSIHGYHELCRRTTINVEELPDEHRHDMRLKFIMADMYVYRK